MTRAPKLVETLRLFNLTNFAIIHTEDVWANTFVKLVYTEAEKRGSGVSVFNSFAFDYGDAVSAKDAVRRLATMDRSVNVFLALVFDYDIESVLDAAHEYGLLTPSNIWIDGNGLSTSPLSNKNIVVCKLEGKALSI